MFGVPRQRSVADVDNELACHAYLQQQAIEALNADDAANAHARINELLDERLKLQAAQ